MRLGETLSGLLLQNKPEPINGTFLFLITEILEYDGRKHYVTYERDVPEENLRFRKVKGGYKMYFVGDPFYDLRSRLTNYIADDILVYPRFEEIYVEIAEGSSVR